MRKLSAPAIIVAAVLCTILSAPAASAQSALTGTVTDASGAVLPGVTVEAASPALIERVRSVTSDARGQYRIIDLRPGVYTVTFTLTGFATVVRDGIRLETDFTGNVNAEMRIGTVEETVTVSGQSPVVDLHTTQRREVLTREVLDSLPTGRNFETIGKLIPSINMGRADVGGSTTMQQLPVMANGGLSSDMVTEVDGMSQSCPLAAGQHPCLYHNDGAYEEYVFQVSGGSAESSTAGVRINMVPREGSNQFRGDGVAIFSNSKLQSQNVTPELRERGVRAPERLEKLWDFNFSAGFPIIRDRLWWFTSVRNWGYNNFAPNAFNPDGTQAVDDNTLQAYTNRVTFQLAPQHKLTAMYDKLPKYRGHRSIETGLYDPKATDVQTLPLAYGAQTKWTWVAGQRILVDGGLSIHYFDQNRGYRPEVARPSATNPFGDVSKLDIVTQRRTNAQNNERREVFKEYSYVASASYVTGSHSIKAGAQYSTASVVSLITANGDMVQRYSNGVPHSVQRWNTPSLARSNMDYDFALYLQDSWVLRRVTLNPGVRFEAIRGSVPQQSIGAGRFVAARTFEAIPNLPNWKHVSPRFGVAVDAFGNGRTAIKGALGRYVQQEATGFAATYNPMVLASDVVTWRDLNGNDLAEDNELGRPANATLGARRNVNPAPDLKRPYQLLYHLGVQQELHPGLSVETTYYRREYYDLTTTVNLAAPHSAYTLVEIPDPRGLAQTLPVYNIQPEFFGLVNELDSTSPNNRRTFNGFDVLVNARRWHGATFTGGVNIGRVVSVACDVPNPNSLRFCDQRKHDLPFQTTLKLAGSHELPWGVRLSGALISTPGAAYNVNYIVSRAQIPTLTQASVTVSLDPPGQHFQDRVTQLDFALAKTVRTARFRITPQLDLFNTFNASPVTSLVNTFGPALGTPGTILGPRLIRAYVKVAF